MLETASFW